MSIEDFIITVFCLIEDELEKLRALLQVKNLHIA